MPARKSRNGSSRPGRAPQSRAWLRFAGTGIELAGAVAGFSLLGFWIDRRYDTSPWGLLICALCGAVGGFYNFIRSSFKAFHPPDPNGSDSSDDSNH